MIAIQRLLLTVEDIKSALKANDITAKEAVNLLAHNTRKTWHTREWKEQRDSLLGDKCTQCNTSAPPLVLQHMWQPRKLTFIIGEMKRKYLLTYEAQNPKVYVPKPKPAGTATVCPSCHLRTMYWRKTTQDWRCGTPRCRFIFKEPISIPALTDDQYHKWSVKQADADNKWYREFNMAHEEEYLAEALEIGFAENARYMSCKDTTTFCRKCAFMWDKKQRKLCSGCKKYVPFYTTEKNCFNCNDSWFTPPDIDEIYAQYENQ